MQISPFPLPTSVFAFGIIADGDILRYRAPANVEHYQFDPNLHPTPEVGTRFTFNGTDRRMDGTLRLFQFIVGKF